MTDEVAGGRRLDVLKAAGLLREIDNYFGITSTFIGAGCEHGFKPAKNCPNEKCDARLAHLAWQSLREAVLPFIV